MYIGLICTCPKGHQELHVIPGFDFQFTFRCKCGKQPKSGKLIVRETLSELKAEAERLESTDHGEEKGNDK